MGSIKFSGILSITIAVSFFLIGAASAETWEKTFGGFEHDEGYFVQQTSDGGYIIVGETSSFGVTVTDVYLIKTDANGDEIWSKTFGGSGYEHGRSVIQIDNSGYIIVGEDHGDVYLIYFKPTPALADFDGNLVVDLADAIIALRVLAGFDTSGLVRSDYATSGTDVDGDGKIGLAEIAYIMQNASGLR
jgi:hypothetical protein